MQRLVGKTAIVTGASSGIGAATVVELVKNGLKVIGVARRVEKVEALQSQLQNAPGKLIPRKADISSEEDVTALFRWVKDTFGTLHILVNNAGVSRYGKVTAQNPEYWRQVFNTNVIGTTMCSQQAIKLMRETGVDDGHIVLMGSVLGTIIPPLPDPFLGIYPASKFAVRALTEILRQELRFLNSKIKVSHLSPGLVESELGEAANAAMEAHERQDRISRFKSDAPPPSLQPEEVANSVLYVLSAPPNVQVHELMILPVGSTI